MSVIATNDFARAPSPEPPRARPRRRTRLGPGPAIPYGMQAGSLLLIVLWTLGSATGLIDPRILSAPWTVIGAFRQLIADGRLQEHFAISGWRALSGLAVGVVIGTVLAVIAGLSRWGEALIDGPIQIKRAVPTLALIPLLMLWFGIGEQMKIVTIILAVIVPIYIHTHNGLRSIDSRYVELSETLNLSRWEFIREVVLPGALPGFLLGLRFAVTLAWVSLVVVEQVNATSGLGYMINLARTYGQTEIIIAGIVVYAALGLVSDGVVRLIERRALSWRRTLSS
ncbi:ABC transporter permease [Paracoccus aminophilus]|uniref:ABC-type nitrate/sulfonate/bicarbonate transport system, permease component n=1 Tax=Paracoccus aminophilus JCM 7686 TaxID=1367847 RepID=S5YHM7_PARAH|nr:ABC transporter permease [Paracoccus aminophilus]AGT10968.1 ABC-type nitrate/sulfonate/bicarbonate transport system, permease component [Paracoccus aminophilus JCM 7686]